MCDPTGGLILMGVGTAVSAYSQIEAGNAQAAAADAERRALGERAKQERLAAVQAENDRREQAMELSASNRALMSAQGVGENISGQAFLENQEDKAARDITRMRLQGDFTQSNIAQQQGQLRVEAKAAKRAGLMGAIGTGISGGYSMYKNS